MADITDPETRSRMMSGIRGRDTQPELEVRRALHRLGLRFRLHAKGLSGKPDLVFPRYEAAVFVHGCFWHQHGCANSRLPSTRPEFWAAKLQSNVERDARNRSSLLAAGWRVAVVWECSIRRAQKGDESGLFDAIATWVRDRGQSEASF